MDTSSNIDVIGLKGVITTVVAFISAKLGLLGPVMIFLAILMAGDWITGMMASAFEKMNGSNKPSAGWSSKKGASGIFKKVSYLIAVCVGIGLDWLILAMAKEFDMAIPLKAFFGLLVALWYVLNEMLSIIENLNRMDARIPSWLVRTVKYLQDKVDDAGEEVCDEDDGGKPDV